MPDRRIGTIAKFGNDVNASGTNERTVQHIRKIRRHNHNTPRVLQDPIQQVQEKRQIDLVFVLVMLENRLVCVPGFGVVLLVLILERPFHDNVALTVHVFENVNTLIQRDTVSFRLTRHRIHYIQILVEKEVLQLGLGHVVVQIHITNVSVGFVGKAFDGRRFTRPGRPGQEQAQCVGNTFFVVPLAILTEKMDAVADDFNVFPEQIGELAVGLELFHDKGEIGGQARQILAFINVHGYYQWMHVEIVTPVAQFVLHIDGIFLFDVVQEITQLIGSFGEAVDLDDLDNGRMSPVAPCARIHVGRDASLIAHFVGRGRLRHTCEDFVVDMNHVLLIQDETFAHITHMRGVFIVGDKVEEGLPQNVVGVVHIDGHGDGRRLLFHLVIGQIFGDTGQVLLDVLQFIGVFLHEKIDDHGRVFENEIDHTGGDKHVNHGEHVIWL